jgi:hypothetical protein
VNDTTSPGCTWATKGIGARRRLAPMALIGDVEPHDRLSVLESSASKSPWLTPSRGRHLVQWV